jgi:hypothetical protein
MSILVPMVEPTGKLADERDKMILFLEEGHFRK